MLRRVITIAPRAGSQIFAVQTRASVIPTARIIATASITPRRSYHEKDKLLFHSPRTLLLSQTSQKLRRLTLFLAFHCSTTIRPLAMLVLWPKATPTLAQVL